MKLIAIYDSLWEMRVIEISTPAGLARAHLYEVAKPAGAMVLGHGAGGGIGARDLQVAKDAALEAGYAVALVEQPYRVAGKRAPARAPQLDAAWVAVVEQLRDGALAGPPLIVGGRSAGARVACRTGAHLSASAVLCLAFPLRPPRAAGREPAQDRQHELDEVTVPTLVVQGVSDPFGMPRPGANRAVVQVAGNHSLTSDLPAVRVAVEEWLKQCLT